MIASSGDSAARQLEKAAVFAERQIWRRAQSMSPSPVQAGITSSPGIREDGLSRMEALDQMQKSFERQVEAAKAQYANEVEQLRRENATLKQQLKGVSTDRESAIRNSATVQQLQAQLDELRHELTYKDVALSRAESEASRLADSESSIRLEATQDKRDRSQHSALHTFSRVLAQWGRDARFTAMVVWRTNFQEERPILIDTAKVKSLEREAAGYRTQIRQLVSDVKEAMTEVRENKRLHLEDAKRLQKNNKQLEKILSASPDSAEARLLRQEILQLKAEKQELESRIAKQ